MSDTYTDAGIYSSAAMNAFVPQLLDEFCGLGIAVQSATVSTPDGIPIASTCASRSDAARLSAMSSSIAALTGALSTEVGHSEADCILLESPEGRILTYKVTGGNAVLIFMTVVSQHSALGSVLWNCRNTVEKLSDFLGNPG